jgi:hypothetical protein
VVLALVGRVLERQDDDHVAALRRLRARARSEKEQRERAGEQGQTSSKHFVHS